MAAHAGETAREADDVREQTFVGEGDKTPKRPNRGNDPFDARYPVPDDDSS